MSQLTLTVDTEDIKVVREAAEMLLRLSGSVELPFVASVGSQLDVATIVTMKDSMNQGATISPITTDTPPPPTEALAEEEETDEQQQPEGAVDSAGTPWDERIHSSSRATLKSDGTWKLKKGVDKALVAQVMAELLGNARTDTSATPNSASTPPPPGEHTADTSNTGPTGVAVHTGLTPPPPSTPAPTTEQSTGGLVNGNFGAFTVALTRLKLAPAFVQEMIRSVGLADMFKVKGSEATLGQFVVDVISAGLTPEYVVDIRNQVGITELTNENVDTLRMALGL